MDVNGMCVFVSGNATFFLEHCGATSISIFKPDDGWPESVEEQGLLLLVLRHYITRQYIKDVS
jgi:hypothetical protein